MVRYLLSFFLALSLFVHADDDDDDEPPYYSDPIEVTYGGMTIYCPWGCEDYDDARIKNAAAVLGKQLRAVFDLRAPFETYSWGCDIPYDFFPFRAWKRDSNDFFAYDWENTSGLLVFPNQRIWRNYSIETYPKFLELAAALRRDVHFYYREVPQKALNFFRSIMPRLIEARNYMDLHRDVRIEPDGTFEFFYTDDPFASMSSRIDWIKRKMRFLKEDLTDDTYGKKIEELEEIIQQVDGVFRNIFNDCLRYHQEEGIVFHTAIEHLIHQDYEDAIEQLRSLIQWAEDTYAGDDLLAKLHLLKGQVQSEFGLYADAIVALTAAIQKAPEMKEAYFERAVAYFELGDFERALEDYLTSGFRPQSTGSHLQLSLGITAGIIDGTAGAAAEFIPSMFSTLRGLANGLWALACDPGGVSSSFINAAIECVEIIKSTSTAALLEEIVPELKELIESYDNLENFKKGSLIGQIIGKYGTDIFLAKQGTALIKAYRNLKQANQLMTLEALATPGKKQAIVAATEKRNELKECILKDGKIESCKQGKHIIGHPNYENLRKLGRNPSILTHSNPERLLREYAGKGIKDKGSIPGSAGYIEIVDFKEMIGYSVHPETGEKAATTLGKIHYSKNGAHIVPTLKKGRNP